MNTETLKFQIYESNQTGITLDQLIPKVNIIFENFLKKFSNCQKNFATCHDFVFSRNTSALFSSYNFLSPSFFSYFGQLFDNVWRFPGYILMSGKYKTHNWAQSGK